MRLVIAVALGVLLLAGCSRPNEAAMTGWVEADLVYVSAPAAGVVQKIEVQRGDRVARAAPLFVLDTDAEQLARLEAEARLAQARAASANLRSGRRPPEVAAIEQQRVQAEAALSASRAQLARNSDLVQRGFVAPGVLDDLRAAEQRDAARVRELQAQLQVARLAARPDEIAAADAAARAARAQLELDRWREQQKTQRAPLDAVVYDLMYRVGERVPANAPVVALLPAGALKLRFYAPQPALSRLPVGTPLAVRCDGCPAGIAARVSFVSPQAEFTPPVIYSNDSRSKLVFMLEARFEGSAPALAPGQPIEVRLAAPAAAPASNK